MSSAKRFRRWKPGLSGGDVALEGRIDDGEEEFAPIAYLADADSEPTQVLQRREYDVLQSEGVREALAGSRSAQPPHR